MINKKEFHIQTKVGVYRVRIWWDKVDKAYLVKAVTLPGVVTFGASLADAKRMAKDAIELYGECLRRTSLCPPHEHCSERESKRNYCSPAESGV